MKIKLLCIPLAALILTSCVNVEVINHPQPELNVDFYPFEDIGCPMDDYGFRRCQEFSPMYVLGCDLINPVSELIGGLSPKLPMAECVYRALDHLEVQDAFDIPDNEYIFRTGGLAPELVRYVIFKEGEFLLVKNLDEFRKIFAPVESPEEALSFTLALMNFSARYGMRVEDNLKYYVKTLEDTHVDSIDGGYLVNVFKYQLFGCGPHYTYGIHIFVDYEGNLQELSREKLYNDPSQDDLCVD